MSTTPSSAELAAEIRALAELLHEFEADPDSRASAFDDLRKAGKALTGGQRRLRWYEQTGGTDSGKTRNRDLSPFSGELNAIAPPMRFTTGENDHGEPALVGRVNLGRLREGPPHTVHGGVVAGLFDEILGAGQRLAGGMGGVTGRLVVRYRRPTPLSDDLEFRAWVHDERSRRLVMRADCRVGSAVTAEAEAVFIRVDFAGMEQKMRDRVAGEASPTAPRPGADVHRSTASNPLTELLRGKARLPADPADDRPMIIFLCTGNAARSVMAAAMMRDLLGPDSDYLIASGGTHVLPGQPMSVRTRKALERYGLADPWHRSHQLGESDIERAGLIVAMEPMHLDWMQRTHPQGLSKTGSLARLARELSDSPGAGSATSDLRSVFDARVAALDLNNHKMDDWEEIVDPASGEQPEFDACADLIHRLIGEFHSALLQM